MSIIVSIKTIGGLEIVGKSDLNQVPVKTEDGWLIPGILDPESATEVFSFKLSNPFQMMPIPTPRGIGNVMVPLMASAAPPQEMVMFTADIMAMGESLPNVQEDFMKATCPIDVSTAAKNAGLSLVRGPGG